MLVKIPTEKAVAGMFVHEIVCSWWEHPFWRRQMLLRTAEQLRSLQQSGASYVIIDDEKGTGYNSEPDSKERNEATRAPFPKTAMTADVARARVAPAIPALRKKNGLTPSQRLAEIKRARGTLNRSKVAVKTMFEDARMGKAIQTRQMASMVNQLKAAVDRDPAIILNMARLKTKDDYTYMHSVSVCALMINLARTLKLDESIVREAGIAGLLHDVGKVAIPTEILLKPAGLSDVEFEIVRDHPQAGYNLLAASKGVSAAALDVCLHHHEKMDGSGYPDKLEGEQLQLLTRMAAICDVYDAVTSQRSYNSPWTPSEALARMQSWRGHFDQITLRAFVESLGILPAGTLVRLTNDHLAIVTGETNADYSLPKIRLFYSIARSRKVDMEDFEISRSAHCLQISSVEDPDDWGFENWQLMKKQLLGPRPVTQEGKLYEPSGQARSRSLSAVISPREQEVAYSDMSASKSQD